MTDQEPRDSQFVDLHETAASLLAAALRSRARRAATTVYGSRDTVLRQTLIALAAEAELGEHDSPPEATLQVLSGRVRLIGDGRSWTLTAGDLIPIPPERHSVSADEDSVFLLSVLRAVAGPEAGA